MVPGVDVEYLKRDFLRDLQTEEGRDKFAASASAFVRQKLRERSFAEKILPPEPVSEDEFYWGIDQLTGVQPLGGVGTENQGDTPYLRKAIEPDSQAMAINFRSDPPSRYVEGSHYFIPVGMFASEEHEKREQELAAYDYDICKVLEDLEVKELDKQKDVLFLRYADAALALTSKVIDVDGPLTRNQLAQMQQPLIKDQVPPHAYLMSDATFTNMLEWDNTDLGDNVKEVTVGGYTYTEVLGMRFVRSLKADMFDTFGTDGRLATAKVYCFTSPDFLGHAAIWGSTKVWSNWKGNLFQWYCWENYGMGFGNIKGISRLDLTYTY